MKKLLLIGVALIAVATVQAQTNQSWWSRLISFEQQAIEAKQLTIAAYPGYAPDLKVDGNEKPWGAGLAALYPVASSHTLVGARIDWLADSFWAPSANVTLQADVQLLGHNFTPFAIGGAIFPLGGAGDDNGEVGAIFGGGVYTTVWKPSDKASLQVFAAYERWTNLDVSVYRPGVAFTLTW